MVIICCYIIFILKKICHYYLDMILFSALLMISICLQQIYLNTSALIAHEIKTNLTNRKDLALTYYPSEYEFYWFVSRTFSKLQEHSQHQRLHPVSSIQVLQVQQLYEIIFVFHIFLLYHKSLTHLIYISAQYFLILKVFQRFHFSVFLSPIEVLCNHSHRKWSGPVHSLKILPDSYVKF